MINSISKKNTGFFSMLLVLPVISLVIGLMVLIIDGSLSDFFSDYQMILLSPTILLTDFFEVGGVGATLISVALVGFINLWLMKKCDIKLNGLAIAAFFTLIGFSFFGKNILNIMPIYIGGLLYTRYQKIKFGEVLLVMMFATALAPIVSEISFGGFMAPGISLAVGMLTGIFIGFIIVPLASHMLLFHQGYNLYNIGFTAGIVGTVLTSVLRSFDVMVAPVSIIYKEQHIWVAVYLIAIEIVLIVFGLINEPKGLKNLRKTFSHTGRAMTDFTFLVGYGTTLVNMGLMGLVATVGIILAGGILNGPVVAGIFTLIGFAAFGKNFYNCVPIMSGVIVSSLIVGHDVLSTGILIAILFSTTLAPIAGTYGPIVGFIAGCLHLVLVTNVGVVHGGINLYNNGFAGGLVSGFMIPIIDAFRKGK